MLQSWTFANKGTVLGYSSLNYITNQNCCSSLSNNVNLIANCHFIIDLMVSCNLKSSCATIFTIIIMTAYRSRQRHLTRSVSTSFCNIFVFSSSSAIFCRITNVNSIFRFFSHLTTYCSLHMAFTLYTSMFYKAQQENYYKHFYNI